jgi:phytanoyl-CoA hydroxylase
VNKIGHALHDIEPFRAVSFSPAVAGILASLDFERPAIAQSMEIVKPRGCGGAVLPHVDGAFLATTPQTVIGFWWALEKCTQQNGCLWAVPGSHARPVARRFIRDPSGGGGCVFEPAEEVPFSLEGAVPLEVGPGALVLLHSALVHFSEANTNPLHSRHAYSIHVVETGRGVQ